MTEVIKPINLFEKRTDTQREDDRKFIADILQHDWNAKKIDIFEKLLTHIKERGDDYTLEYGYVCTEVSKIRKKSVAATVDVLGERDRSLEIINDNIAMCMDEIKTRYTAREDVTTHIYDLTVKDLKKLSIEEIALINKLQDRVKKRYVSIKKIRPGSDMKEIMEMLYKWVQAKRELLGEDEPKKISQKITQDIEIKSMNYDVLEIELKILGYDPSFIKEAIKKTING